MSALFALWFATNVARLATHSGNVSPLLLPLNLAMAIAVALLAVRALRTRIIFQPDQVIFDSGFSQYAVRRDQILGWRIASNQLYFELRDRREAALLVTWATRGDLRIRAWIAGIPRFDLDAVLLDKREGPTGDRERMLATARRLTLYLNVGTGIFGVWMTAAGHPVAAVALILAPWLALALTAHSSGFIRFQNDYPNGLVAAGIACGILPLRTSMSTTAVDANHAWTIAVVIGLLCSAAAARFTPLLSQYRPWIPIIIGAALLYGYGAGMQINRLLDGTPAVMYRVPLLARDGHVQRSMQYRLRVGPWGGRRNVNTVEVPKDRWLAIRKGDTVCIPVYPGALGAPWFDPRTIASCP